MLRVCKLTEYLIIIFLLRSRYVNSVSLTTVTSDAALVTLPTADDNVGGRCLVIVGYGWPGHASVDRQHDSPHAAASLVYSTPPLPHSTAIQGLKNFSKMQLHRAATRAFGYTVRDGSLLADRRRRSDYVTAFHLAGRFPLQDLRSRPCDT